MISTLFRRLFAPSASQAQAHRLYHAAVTQARQPYFYRDLQVADTLDGRFDLIALHVFMLSHALERSSMGNAQTLRTSLLEVMIADMDHSLREMGVGDVGVAKKVPKMAYAMNGRLQRYAESADDTAALTEALWRNVYRSDESRRPQAEALAEEVKRTLTHLADLHEDAWQSAETMWPSEVISNAA